MGNLYGKWKMGHRNGLGWKWGPLMGDGLEMGSNFKPSAKWDGNGEMPPWDNTDWSEQLPFSQVLLQRLPKHIGIET